MFDIENYQKKAEIQILLFQKGQNVGCLYWKGDSLTPWQHHLREMKGEFLKKPFCNESYIISLV